MEKIIFHIDVNNAFLSWTAVELLKIGYKEDIRNCFSVIGGSEQQRAGIVLAKSNPCKELGIKTADTLYSARQKCGSLKVYPPDYDLYQRMSNNLFKLLSKYTNDIEIASIDECYLEYGPVKKLYGNQHLFAEKIQKEIYDTYGFTVNIGIANNKLCAKMASDFSKPNKIHTLYRDEVEIKMWPLEINELFGVGKQTTVKLKEMNIKTIGDLANYDLNKLEKNFKNMAYSMINKAKGIDDSRIVLFEEAKGLGNEMTLSKDATTRKEINELLFKLANKVGLRLRSINKYAYVIVVVLKNSNFKRTSHQRKLTNPTNISNEIYRIASNILEEMWNYEPIRLVGIRLDNLIEKPIHQVSLFEDFEERKEDIKIDKIVDELQMKYGESVIKKASLK